MTEKLDDVWFTRDYPVLREVKRRIDGDSRVVPTSDDVAAALGIDSETAKQTPSGRPSGFADLQKPRK